MNRRIPIFTLLATLSLLALGAEAVEAQSAQLLASAAQPEMSAACATTQEQCTVNCLGYGERGAMLGCLMACDNAAALCARDDEPTLSSEWYTEQFGNVIATKAGACHDTTPCPSEYASCGSGCGEPLCFDEATRQSQERYRVCFNQQGQACTEYQRISTVVSCGC